MSLISSIESGLSKAEAFLISAFTKASAWATIVSKLGPGTLAAMLAVFHDVITTLTAAGNAAESAVEGNFPSAITFSATTKQLLLTLVADFKAAEATVVADLKALEVA